MYDQTFKSSYHWKENKRKEKGLKTFSSLKFIFVLIMLIASLFFTAYQLQSQPPFVYSEVTVEKGDTLWSIASSFNKENEDIRKIISQIKKINQIDDPVLHPGQKIIIPAI